jgi:hypothetical protein
VNEPDGPSVGGQSDRSFRQRVGLVTAVVLVIGFAVGAGGVAAVHRSLWAVRSGSTTTSSTSPSTTVLPTSTTTQPAVASLVSLPVSSCSTQFGASPPPVFWTPGSLASELPASVAGQLSYYSGGGNMLLAPKDWQCSAGVGADGSRLIATFAPGSPDPSQTDNVTTTGVLLDIDYTGHGPGSALVCAYFPGSPAIAFARSTGSTCALPAGTHIQRLTPDIVAFTQGSTSGVVIYPQVNDAQASVNVAKLSCNAATLCPYIIADVLARYAPSYTPPTG